MLQWIGPGRVRRALIVLCAALVALAVLAFFSVQISETNHGTTELIDGRPDTSALVLPLALFMLGCAGLLAVLGWRPDSPDSR